MDDGLTLGATAHEAIEATIMSNDFDMKAAMTYWMIENTYKTTSLGLTRSLFRYCL